MTSLIQFLVVLGGLIIYIYVHCCLLDCSTSQPNSSMVGHQCCNRIFTQHHLGYEYEMARGSRS